MTEQEIKEGIRKLLPELKYLLVENLLKRALPEEDCLIAYYPLVKPGERYELNLITRSRYIKIGLEQEIYFYKACYINRFTWMTERFLASEDNKNCIPIMTVEIFFDLQNEDFARLFLEAETEDQQSLLKYFVKQFNIIAFKTG
ncbi:MAG: hypothetical protein JXA60_11220 [Candidatus Coatesbacteria bacterium]|nr:hypothetical protein [Candidatus Coatesbacteria bacterium]